VHIATRTLRARCDDHIRRLNLSLPFELPDLLAAVARERQRTLEVKPSVIAGSSPCGALITTEDRDIIRYPRDTTALHRNHIIVHEVVHLLRHDLDEAGDDETSLLALADTDTMLAPGEFIHRIFGRSTFIKDSEREVELLTTMVLTRSAAVLGQSGRPDSSPRAMQQQREIAHQLEHLWELFHRVLGAILDQMRLTGLDDDDCVVSLYRRVIELRDAQLLLAPFAHPDARPLADRLARRRALRPAQREAVVEAAILASALYRFQAGCRVPAGQRPPTIPTGEQHGDLLAEATHLSQMGRALDTDSTVRDVSLHCRNHR
jgi:hypothetical protein